jgi:hypothetical protein
MPQRQSIKTLLPDLQVAQHADGRPGRGGIGYFAPTLGGQFAGYVALDSRRASLNPALGALPAITADERALLVQAHREIRALNDACIGDLRTFEPKLSAAVDPYGTLGGDILRDSEVAAPPASLLLEEATVAAVAEAFQRSSLCDGIRAIPPAVRALFPPEKLSLAVDQLDVMLRRPNIGKQSDEFTAIAFQTSSSFPPRIALEYQAALVGLRSALRVLDQLVFQACYIDRLPALDSENLIKVDGPATSISERIVNVTIQPSGEMSHPKPGELAYFVHPRLGAPFNSLGEIISVRFEMSQETGSVIYLSLHLTDENLNPSPLYSSLARTKR